MKNYQLTNTHMNKRILFFAISTFIISIISLSCKRNFTCTCTIDDKPEVSNYPNSKKKDAKAECDEWEKKYTAAGGSCVLNTSPLFKK